MSLRGAPTRSGRRSNLVDIDRLYCVYIMANRRHTVLYVGVTNDLKRRAYEHRNRLVPGFTKRYNADVLVYYQVCEDVTSAIRREKQLKGGSRAAKITAIESLNASWRDLFGEI